MVWKENYMEEILEKLKLDATELIKGFKGERYIFGLDCIDRIGVLAEKLGRSTVLVISKSQWAEPVKKGIIKYLKLQGVKILEIVNSSKPNSPVEDLYLLQDILVKEKPRFLIAAGGGSTIDLAKAASILASLSPAQHNIEPFFGTGIVSERLAESGKKLLPLLASQMAASSAAHLTKYSNISDTKKMQKKLIIDDAIVPQLAIFDYGTTKTSDKDLTVDGALDGISHCLEVYYQATPENYKRVERICTTGIKILISYLQKSLHEPYNLKYREMLGLGTDLGGYAIMVGGTNGAHLTSFSLIDILSHGRSCGIMNPYFTVFFAPAIKSQLKELANIFSDYMETGSTGKIKNYPARKLAETVAQAMINFLKSLDVPHRLRDVKGFDDSYIEKILLEAKNPQLEMKLKNMPVSLNGGMVEEYLRPVLEAAKTGDFTLIKNQ